MASPKTALATLPAYLLDQPAPPAGIVGTLLASTPLKRRTTSFLIEEAAVRLALTPVALRARCRRSAQAREDGAHHPGSRSWAGAWSPTSSGDRGACVVFHRGVMQVGAPPLCRRLRLCSSRVARDVAAWWRNSWVSRRVS